MGYVICAVRLMYDLLSEPGYCERSFAAMSLRRGTCLKGKETLVSTYYDSFSSILVAASDLLQSDCALSGSRCGEVGAEARARVLFSRHSHVSCRALSTMSTESSDFDKWEAEQLRIMALVYDSTRPPPPIHTLKLHEQAILLSQQDTNYRGLAGIEESLAHFQHQLYVQMSRRVASGMPFEEGWIALSEARRRTILTASLPVAMNFIVRCKDARVHCPEVRVDRLMEDGGRPLIRLMNQVATLGADGRMGYLENDRFNQFYGKVECVVCSPLRRRFFARCADRLLATTFH